MVGYSGHNWFESGSTMVGMDLAATTVPAPISKQIDASSPVFPSRFFDLPVPPRALWFEGRVPRQGEQLLAIVGSRGSSRAASAQVAGLAADLTRAGWAIVSGGALGIDAAAHRGALEAGGATFAVLGCGIDVVYPDRHLELFRQIARGGGLLSEYGPGVRPHPGQFPVRNRLVAAMAQAVIVGESRRGSGALITARLAIALGRPLLAIPGSVGSDGLLASGAAVSVESAADVIAALADQSPAAARPPGPYQALRDVLADGPATAEVIAGRLGLPLGEALGALFEAELCGAVARAAGGRFEVTRGC
jgi:DNA processing protein